MCSSISQSIPQTKQSPCIFKLVVLACTTRCTDSASFEELMKSIWGLKLAFHVEAFKKYTDSHVCCTWRKILDRREIQGSLRKTHSNLEPLLVDDEQPVDKRLFIEHPVQGGW